MAYHGVPRTHGFTLDCINVEERKADMKIMLMIIGILMVIVLILLGLSLLGRDGPVVEACAAAYILPLLGILARGLR